MYVHLCGYIVNKGGRLVWRSRVVDCRTRTGGKTVGHKNNTGIEDGVDDSEKRARSNRK